MRTCKECMKREECIANGDRDAIAGAPARYCTGYMTNELINLCSDLGRKVLSSSSDNKIYVYRICPKCNSSHTDSCRNCAWCGTGGVDGCSVFGIWNDGEYPPDKCTIVKYPVYWNRIPTLMKELGDKVFFSEDEAKIRLENLRSESKTYNR